MKRCLCWLPAIVLCASLAVPALSAQSASLGGILISDESEVAVEVLSGDAQFISDLYLLSEPPILIANNREIGRTVNLGLFPKGSVLLFGIIVRQTEQRFVMGDGAQNPDGLVHAVANQLPDGSIIVSFEDSLGGGDGDYDDVQFRFFGVSVNELPVITSGLVASPEHPGVAEEIFFSAGALDPDGDAVTYVWNFGDGITLQDTTGSLSHSYSTGSIYIVTLTVSDGRGGTATTSVVVDIGCSPFSPINLARLKQMLKADEGILLTAIKQKQRGLMIGVGFNLKGAVAKKKVEALGLNFKELVKGIQGLADEHVETLLQGEIESAIAAAGVLIPNFDELSAHRKEAIVDMIFAMGASKFKRFKKFIVAVKKGDFNVAADEIAKSRLLRYFEGRSLRLQTIIRDCTVPALPPVHVVK